MQSQLLDKTKTFLSRVRRVVLRNTVYHHRYFTPIFIVSTGRTGTNFFDFFFNQSFHDVHCVHEPKPDFFDIGMSKIREGMLTEEVVDKVRALRLDQINKMINAKKSYYIESNPHLAYIIPELKKAYPKAKFVVLSRDPRQVVVSYYNKSPLNDNVMFTYADNDHRLRLRALDFEKDPYFYVWNDFSRIEKIAWFWNKCNELIMSSLPFNSDRVLHLKYEEFFGSDNRRGELKKLLYFVGLKMCDDDLIGLEKILDHKRNINNNVLIRDFDTWQEEDQEKLLQLTKPMREILGYA
ncbi:sulfotransferase family protein [Algivirga pacifica]|uniref:Sulfotransferase domain-containing protein n=1 Tax=Algivirga pacifica TaxID=1162670 RepID=A0ABP9DIK6_9BACT